MAVSYGTREWLAELIRSGWTATVVERRVPGGMGEGFVAGVGVMVTDENGAGVFIPCSCQHEALELLESAEEEA
jgi:hypothetical protein